MRQLLIGAAISLAAIAAVWGQPTPSTRTAPPLSSHPMMVEAQEVQFGRSPALPRSINPHRLTGKFTIRIARPGEPFVRPGTFGGACLMAQFYGADRGCFKDHECDYPVAGRVAPWRGYCVREKDSLPGNLGTNSCWVKPSEDYCLKGVYDGTHYIPTVDVDEVYGEARKYSQNPVKWMVSGCINGAITDRDHPPCGGGPGERRFSRGPIRSLP